MTVSFLDLRDMLPGLCNSNASTIFIFEGFSDPTPEGASRYHSHRLSVRRLLESKY